MLPPIFHRLSLSGRKPQVKLEIGDHLILINTHYQTKSMHAYFEKGICHKNPLETNNQSIFISLNLVNQDRLLVVIAPVLSQGIPGPEKFLQFF